MADIYTLLKKGDGESDEYHLFKATWTDDEHQNCKPAIRSICKKMKSSDRAKDAKGKNLAPPFACAEEDAARNKCAKRGRSVCGICVSSLYRTPED